MWVVNVRPLRRGHGAVWLSEVVPTSGGHLVGTGRRTPAFSFWVGGPSVDRLADRVGDSLSILEGESIIAVSDELVIVAAELAERLGDVLGSAVGGDADGSQSRNEGEVHSASGGRDQLRQDT